MSENNKIEEVANYDILYNVINTDPEKVMNIRIIDNDHPCTLYIGYKLDNNCSFFDEKANKDFLKNKEVYYLYSSEIDKRSYLAPMIMGTDYNEEYPVPGYSFVGTVIYHKDLKFINTINNYGNVSSMVQDYGFPQYDYLRYGGGTGIKYPYYSNVPTTDPNNNIFGSINNNDIIDKYRNFYDNKDKKYKNDKE